MKGKNKVKKISKSKSKLKKTSVRKSEVISNNAIFKKGGKREIKVLFEITVKGLRKLDYKYNEQRVGIKWKRGGKSTNTGETPKVVVRHNVVTWDSRFGINATLIYNIDKGTFSKKELTFTAKLYPLGAKKATIIGSLVINLADYASPDGTITDESLWSRDESEHMTLELAKKKKSKTGPVDTSNSPLRPELLLNIKSRWIKCDGKKLVRKEKPANMSGRLSARKSQVVKQSSEENILNVGGVDFALETATELSEAADTTLGSSDQDDITFDDDSSEDPFLENSTDIKLKQSQDKREKEFKFHETSSSEGEVGSGITSRSSGSHIDKASTLLEYQQEITLLRTQLAEVQAEKKTGGEEGKKPAEGTLYLSQIIMLMEEYYKSDTSDTIKLVHWLAFSSRMLVILQSFVPLESEVWRPVSFELSTSFVPKEKNPDIDILQELSPTERTLYVLQLMICEIFHTLVDNYQEEIERCIIDPLIEEQCYLWSADSAPSGIAVRKLVNLLRTALEVMEHNVVFDSLRRQFFEQVFYFIVATIHNVLMNRGELSTCGFGFHLKFIVSELSGWIISTQDPSLIPARHQFDILVHLANVLVLEKSVFENEQIDELTETICPSLSIFVVQHLLSNFSPDEVSAESVPLSVLSKLQKACKNRVSPRSFNLDPNEWVAEAWSHSSSTTSTSTHSKGNSKKSSKRKSGKKKRKKKSKT